MATNPRLLKLAREASGWTQKSLAKESGVAQGSISRYEQGLQEPSELQVQSIAEALGYPGSFFGQLEARPTTVMYRTRVLRSAKLEAQVRARLNLTRLIIGRLLEHVDIDVIARFPQPDQSYDDPLQAARALRTAWGVVPGPIESVSELIESAGGIVVRADLGTEQTVAAYLHPMGDPVRWFIVNSRVTAGDRLRFTLAHELGHAVLHEADLVPDSRDAEREVDMFAGAFLLPHEDLLEALPRGRLSLEELLLLKQRFGVSMQAVAMAAHQAGALSRDELTRLYREIGYRGWRKNEPGHVAIEQPTVIREVVRIFREDHGYSDTDLARTADVSVSVLGDLLPDYFQAPATERHLAVVRPRSHQGRAVR